ncbi:MAG TPA: hypothetical protein VHF22_06370 [Planctomycetota bacterium]|nr:hypothetical protein [Planctomycetota bacterium]
MLTHEEALRLKNESPRELDRRALAEKDEFLFGVRDLRDSLGREWGGEVRVILNQNVVVHLVPRYNDEMRDIDELPQFTIFPDDDHEGEDRTHRYEGVKDLEDFEGVVFYVTGPQYAKLVAELCAAAGRYGDYLRLPDTLFGGTEFVKVLTTRVLEHPVVRAERSFDFSKRTF